jgi:3'-phosphoadenosine 5'-phosphosulfate sulfotransferase (PAPS reductase)/FAD synthetase
MDYKITRDELKRRQAMPLKDKIDMSAEKIESWYDHWNGNVHVAFSGGKDSTVLLHLVRSIFPEIPGMFADTGLEFPEIRNFVKDTPNVVFVKPKMNFKKVIEHYGYPIIGKDQSRYIHEYRRSKSERHKNILLNGNRWGYGKINKKWLFLLDAPFLISHKCCDMLKKYPAHKYEKETGSKPMLGSMTAESFMRRETYLRTGCNAYDFVRPTSTPLAFWKEEDIWDYIHQFNVPYSPIYDMGYDRTGCMFCMFGVHREKNPNRFQKMQITHPKLWDYCINNLGEGKILDYINVSYKNEDIEDESK